jgi:hypothetical protein
MAQWAGQYTGSTHDTRVEDTERALRETLAIQLVPRQQWSDETRSKMIKLAEKVMLARKQAIISRLSRSKHVPTEEAFEKHRLEQVGLSRRLEALNDVGVDVILNEFGA